MEKKLKGPKIKKNKKKALLHCCEAIIGFHQFIKSRQDFFSFALALFFKKEIIKYTIDENTNVALTSTFDAVAGENGNLDSLA
jgi:hypothetical protein